MAVSAPGCALTASHLARLRKQQARKPIADFDRSRAPIGSFATQLTCVIKWSALRSESRCVVPLRLLFHTTLVSLTMVASMKFADGVDVAVPGFG